MVNINDLPDEVLEFIFSYLPPYKDLDECSIVCRRWGVIVENLLRYTEMNFNKGLTEYRVCWKAAPPQHNSTITGRFSHLTAIHEHSMYVFGGRSSTTTTFNDLWCYDLSKRLWNRQLPMGTPPSPKACASMVNYKGNLILFGGVRHPALGPFQATVKLFDELHIYNIIENRWTLYTPPICPPPSAGHSATIRNNQMIVFGGFQATEEGDGGTNDIWCLDLLNYTWHKQETSRNKPPPRYGQFQIVLDDNNILVLGGCGGPNNIFSDAWLLNMTGNIWNWQSVVIKNKKWAATHMWCNPAAKVGTKLIVLGPTPALPTDFQIIKQTLPHSSNNQPRNVTNNFRRADERRLDFRDNRFDDGDVNIPNHPPVPPQPSSNNQRINSNQLNNINNNNNNEDQQQNRNNDEVALRLQRNLQQLRNRDDERLLPKRFDEPFHDRLGMAAFRVNPTPNISSRERQIERLKRMQDKYYELRRPHQNQKKPPADESSSPKRVKRNCIAMFVCDLSKILETTEPTLEWLEYKNYGLVNGAPERLILSSLVPGNGELIMFGGLLRESLTNDAIQVSNSVHFLTVPQGII